MALPKSFFRLHRKLSMPKPLQLSGFTLLELLVAMVVSSIVVSGLLYLVVELLKTDRREMVLNQTQQDMQRALDYIGDDIREAVYIYSTPSTIAGQLSDIVPATDGVPILAFWRPEPVDTSALPASCTSFGASTTTIFRQCEVLKIRQSAYSLVVYLQKPKDSNANWKGKSRIVRYKLDKYSNLATLASTPGYRDPAGEGVNFSAWTSSGATAGTKSVLVDFVDAPSDPPSYTPSCSSLGTGYTIVPSTAATANKSFYGCIRDPGAGTAIAVSGGNQDAYLFLTGNIDGAGGVGALGPDSALPTLETRVLMRGVIDKNPAN